MATGGFEVESEKTRLMEKTDDQDDDDEDERGNETTGFEPGASSTPGPNGNQRQTTLNRTGYLPDTPDLSTTEFAESVIDEFFYRPNKMDIKYRMYNGKVEVGSILSKAQKSFFPLFTEIRGQKGEYHINPQIKGSLLKALGKTKIEVSMELQQKMKEDIVRSKAILDDPLQSETERKKALERIEKLTNRISDEKRQVENLTNKFLTPGATSQSIELTTYQKNNDAREERQQEIQTEMEENDKTINDKNSSTSEKQRAIEDNKRLSQEDNDIENQRDRETDQLPLRERLREKVKAIFKKYGFTVGAVFLAVGTTIGVVLSSLSNGLKAVSKGVGNGLKTLGNKIAQILPGLIGAVVSFVFRTAGNVVGFLGKHAWLLILAVAAFLFERVMKRRG